jgi:tRNA-modifying protein YgfZ
MSLAEEYAEFVERGGVFALSDHTFLQWSGSDWQDWLQGQVTQDLRQLSHESAVSLCLTSSTGQLLSVARLGADGRMVTPSASVEAWKDRVDRFVIMEDVELADLDEPVFHDCRAGSSGLAATRTTRAGVDITNCKGAVLSAALLEVLRLEADLPRFGIDSNPKTLPPELGPEFEAEFISYTKGCYTGQEILQRIHSRGHTNQTWAVYRVDRDVFGSDVMASERKVGVVTSCAEHPALGWLAGAMVRNDADGPISSMGAVLSPIRS